MGNAERAFRDAFSRLKKGTPTILPSSASVTQNNVAREAGVNPSALKKARFPELVREIQKWVNTNTTLVDHPGSNEVSKAKIAMLKATIQSLQAERDMMASELLSAKYKMFEQWQKIQRLEAAEETTVVGLRGKRK
jgi:hypothetical protein